MHDAWMSEDRMALERLRTTQSAVHAASALKNADKELKERSADWRKQLSFLWRSKPPRDLEPAASLFVRPVTYKRGDALRFEELGSRLLNGRVNFMRFVDFACQTLEKASESDRRTPQQSAVRPGTKPSKTSSPSPSPSPSPAAYPSKSSRIWLKYNLAERVAFDADGIELCVKRSKIERKKLKEAAAADSNPAQSPFSRKGSLRQRDAHDSHARRAAQHAPVTTAFSFNSATLDCFEQQALIAYPSMTHDRNERNALLFDEHSVALWRVRFELENVPVSRLAQTLHSAAFLRDVFDLELLETIEQLNEDTVLERLRRCGPADRHVREYTVLRSRRAHFSVTAPDSIAFVLTSVADFDSHLNRPARRATAPPSARSQSQTTDGNNNRDRERHCHWLCTETIQDAVICDLHLLAEPNERGGSRVTVLNREELRGYTHEWYVQAWPIVLARWMVRLRDHFKAA